MFLKIGKSNSRTYLSIAQGYRDPLTGRARTRTIQSIGYLDELTKEYQDPIAYFKQLAKEMNEQEATKQLPTTLRLDMEQHIATDAGQRKYLGYAAPCKIYHELGLPSFLNNRAKSLRIGYSLNNIVKLLVFERLRDPGSKRKAHENRERYFEHTDFSLDDVYSSLSVLSKYTHTLQQWIHQKIQTQYACDKQQVYYDVTNYYFEIDEQDDLRRKGVSKEHRPDPIVQMGLFMDGSGIPIHYQLFPGNTNDCETLLPMLATLKREYDMNRLVVVADKGIKTAKNIQFNLLHGDGYVFSQTVRGAHGELKAYVLDPQGYEHKTDDFKMKSRTYPRLLNVVDIEGKTKSLRVDEKQLIIYSKQYDKHAKAERASAVLKARNMVDDPSKYNRCTSYGAAQYVKNLAFDKKTGEIVTGKQLVFDEDKLGEMEQWDGYYAIITSELDKSDEEILDIYRGLWRIEESFKFTKHDLETRPVYVSREDRIQAHFLICFLALVITRLLERRLDSKFSVPQILQSMRQVHCSHLEENIYLFDHDDEIQALIRSCLGIDFSKKYMTLRDIKKALADTKKVKPL